MNWRKHNFGPAPGEIWNRIFWTLKDAIGPCSREEAWEAWRWAAVGQATAEDPEEAAREVRRLRQIVESDFRDVLASGIVAVFPKDQARSAKPRRIPPADLELAWLDFEASTVTLRPSAQDAPAGAADSERPEPQPVEVRLSPAVHMPDFGEQLAGRVFSEAFRFFVLGDPSLQGAIRATGPGLPEGWSSHCDVLLRGGFSKADPLWPVDFGNVDLFRIWLEPPAGVELPTGGVEHDSEYWSAFYREGSVAQMLADRFLRFMEPLRRGEVIATGHLAQGSPAIAISPAIWHSSETRIDVVNGTLYRVAGGERRLEWTGLMLAAPDREPKPALLRPIVVEQPAALPSSAPSKAAGGRPSLYPWDAAFDRLVVTLWQKGAPENGAELSRMLQRELELEGVDPPDERHVSRWLNGTHPRIWQSVRKGGQN